MSWLTKLTSGLKKSSQKVKESLGGVSRFFGGKGIDASSLEELEDALIMADLGVDAASEITQKLKQHKWDGAVDEDHFRVVLAEYLTELLSTVEQPLHIEAENRPHILLLVGVNGSGKTTTAGKLAARYQKQGLNVMLAAADTFRAAAIEQLTGWGLRTDTPVISAEHGADAAALAYRAIEEARANNTDLLIIDTAGRLQNRTELMDELEKIIRVIRKLDDTAPHDSVIVLDGTVGQNALSQVRAFSQAASLSGMIMTKLDGSAKGGVLVALARETRLPIHMIGVGETADDLQAFGAEEFAHALVGIEAQAE